MGSIARRGSAMRAGMATMRRERQASCCSRCRGLVFIVEPEEVSLQDVVSAGGGGGELEAGMVGEVDAVLAPAG